MVNSFCLSDTRRQLISDMGSRVLRIHPCKNQECTNLLLSRLMCCRESASVAEIFLKLMHQFHFLHLVRVFLLQIAKVRYNLGDIVSTAVFSGHLRIYLKDFSLCRRRIRCSWSTLCPHSGHCWQMHMFQWNYMPPCENQPQTTCQKLAPES